MSDTRAQLPNGNSPACEPVPVAALTEQEAQDA